MATDLNSDKNDTNQEETDPRDLALKNQINQLESLSLKISYPGEYHKFWEVILLPVGSSWSLWIGW